MTVVDVQLFIVRVLTSIWRNNTVSTPFLSVRALCQSILFVCEPLTHWTLLHVIKPQFL